MDEYHLLRRGAMADEQGREWDTSKPIDRKVIAFGPVAFHNHVLYQEIIWRHALSDAVHASCVKVESLY